MKRKQDVPKVSKGPKKIYIPKEIFNLTIEEKIDKILEEQLTIKDDISEITEEMSNLKAEMSNFKAEIKKDISEIKEDVNWQFEIISRRIIEQKFGKIFAKRFFVNSFDRMFSYFEEILSKAMKEEISKSNLQEVRHKHLMEEKNDKKAFSI